jgi:hypothetical protein
MNWQDKSLFIKVPMLLVWVLFLCACESVIGFEDLDLLGQRRTEIRMVEVPLPAVQFKVDSINTTATGRLLMGRLDDEVFGTITATPYFNLNLQGSNFRFDEIPEFRSLILQLKPSYIMGTAGDRFDFRIVQLQEQFQASFNYYNSDTIPGGRVLGAGSVAVDRQTFLTQQVVMSPQFGQELLTLAVLQADPFNNANDFRTFFRGMRLEPLSEGSIAGFAIGDSTQMILRYRLPSETEEREIRFRVDASQHFSSIKQTGGQIPQNIDPFIDFSLPEDVIVMSNGYGIVPKVSLEHLYPLLDTLEFMEILRADVTIGNMLDRNIFNSISRPANFTLPFTNESNRLSIGQGGQTRAVQSEAAASQRSTTSPVAVRYNALNDSYSGQVTSFVQAMKLGILDPIPSLLLWPETEDFERSTARFKVHNDNIKLVIVYSTLKQQ